MRDEIIRRLAERGIGPAEGAAGAEGRVQAAILVPLIDRAEGLTLLFTRRTEHLSDHAGQISFPGGRMEPGDGDSVETALRESEEEIGLPRANVELLARLDAYDTTTGYVITPIVGLVRPPLKLALDSREVAEAFEVPLGFLLDPANRRRERRLFDGVGFAYDVFEYGERCIWGATAGIIVNLCNLLRAA